MAFQSPKTACNTPFAQEIRVPKSTGHGLEPWPTAARKKHSYQNAIICTSEIARVGEVFPPGIVIGKVNKNKLAYMQDTIGGNQVVKTPRRRKKGKKKETKNRKPL